MTSQTIDRRKNKRYNVIKSAYAAFCDGSRYKGEIVDIGMGGLCFDYKKDHKENSCTGENNPDSIFLRNHDCVVENLNSRTVRDYGLESGITGKPASLRRKHLQFVDLNIQQLFDLQYFLQNVVV